MIDLTGHWVGVAALLTFVIAYLVVVGEEFTHLRKSKPMMLAAGIIWAIIAVQYAQAGERHAVEEAVREFLLEYAELFLFLLAAIAAVATDEPVPPHETFTLESAALKETRRINVYTPPGYDAAGATRYPVLYMPDGGLQEDFPHLATTIDTAIRAGEMRPLILVGIENTERRRDLTKVRSVPDTDPA